MDLKKLQFGLSFEGSHWARSPQPRPKESPMATSMGPCIASWSVSAFSLKLIPKKMPNLGSRAMKGRLKDSPRDGNDVIGRTRRDDEGGNTFGHSISPLREAHQARDDDCRGDCSQDKSQHEADCPGESQDEV